MSVDRGRIHIEPATVKVVRHERDRETHFRVSGLLAAIPQQSPPDCRLQAALTGAGGTVLWVDDTSVSTDFLGGDSAPFSATISFPTALVQRAQRFQVRGSFKVPARVTDLAADLGTAERDPETGLRWVDARVLSAGPSEPAPTRCRIVIDQPSQQVRFQVVVQAPVPDGFSFEALFIRFSLLGAQGELLAGDDSRLWDNPPQQGVVLGTARFEFPSTFATRATEARIVVTPLGRWLDRVLDAPVAEIEALEPY